MPYPYPHDDDDFTTDSGTVMTKALITNDGKCPKHPHIVLRGRDDRGRVYQQDSCPECMKEHEQKKEAIRFQKLELERAMRALDTASAGNSSGSSASNTNDHSDSRGHQSNSSPAPYRPPAPLPNGPLPIHFYGNGNGIVSNSGASVGSKGPSPTPPPFNPYDPYYAAAMASHFQQHVMGGPGMPAPPGSSNGRGEDNKYLLKMLEEKEEELKRVRQTLEDTQRQLQDETLRSTKLEAKLDQTLASFESERKLIRFEAEKKAQEQLQMQQQEIFQKQLELMDKWQQGGGGNALVPSLPMSSDESPPPLDARPQADVVAPSPNPDTLMRKSPAVVDSIPMKNNVVSAKSSNSKSSSTNSKQKSKKPWENGKANGGAGGGGAASGNGSRFDESMDNSLINSAKIDFQDTSHSSSECDDDYEQITHPKAPPPTPASHADNSNGQATAIPSPNQSKYSDNNGTTSPQQKSVNAQPSNYFTPIPSKKDEPKPPVPDDGTDGDDFTLGQTVASSTYGEDRIKVINKELFDPYGDKGTYTGVVLRTTGMPHGLGRMIYEEDGRIYEGDWRHGRWHGYGRASFSNGDSYEGDYKFDQRHGQGKYKWHDGRSYDGQFLEDKRHGKGTFTWPDGAVYHGEFVNGQREGQGIYTFADGGQYEGSWKDGRYEGYGTCTWEDGRRYQGEWRNGMAHGKGIETYPNGSIRHEGMWIRDEPVR